MPDDLKLRLILKAPPAGVDFGLQSGHGNAYETVSKQRSGKGDLRFELSVGVKPGPNGGDIDFRGPFVQGKKGERFFYIDIGTYAGQADSPWGRRLKIPLKGITKRAASSGSVLETTISGTAKDGGPACATPKDFSGWKAR
jgi:uncharacterized protein DUF5990